MLSPSRFTAQHAYKGFTVNDTTCQKQSCESRGHNKNIYVTHPATKTITCSHLVQLNNTTWQVTSIPPFHHSTVPLRHRSPLCNSRITQYILLINSNKFTLQMRWKLLSKFSVGALYWTVDPQPTNWDLPDSFNLVSETKRASQFALSFHNCFCLFACPLSPAGAGFSHVNSSKHEFRINKVWQADLNIIHKA
jgi:hypothetical protein